MSGQESGSGGGNKFDPTRHLRQLRGRGGNSDYLDVKWRLVWLRSEHPDAQIATEHVTITADLAIFKAQVAIPGGGSATGYGSETARDFGDFIEKAETKALGRALIALGYGTQFAQEFGEDEVTETVPARAAPPRHEPPVAARPDPIQRAPITPPQPATPQRTAAPATPPRPEAIPVDSRRPTPVRPLRDLDEEGLDKALPLMQEQRPAERPAPARIRSAAPPPEPAPEPEPEPELVARAVPRPAPSPVVRPAPRPTPVVTREPDLDTLDEEEVDMANYGWTEFWSWARARGFSDRKSLDAIVGRPTSGMTPMEIRKAIQAKQG